MSVLKTQDHQLRVTAKLIEIEGVQIVLRRLPAAVETASGGVLRPTTNRTPLDPQRLAFLGVAMDQVRVVDEDGKKVELRWNLIGMPGADIEAKDIFSHNGGEFYVFEVVIDQRGEVRAWVRENGPNAVQA